MKKNFYNVLGLFIILIAVIVPGYLVISKIIDEVLFLLLFAAILATGFLIYKIEEICEFETKIVKLKTLKNEIFAKAEEVVRLSRLINEDKRDLRKSIRVFIETLYLSLATRNRFPIPEKVADEINKNLNLLTNLAIKNKGEDKEWSARMEAIKELINNSQR